MEEAFTRRGVLLATTAATTFTGCGRASEQADGCPGSSPSSAQGPIQSTTRSVDLPGTLAELWVAPTWGDLPAPGATPAVGLTPTAGVLVANSDADGVGPTETVRTNVATVLVGVDATDVGTPDCFPAVAVTLREGLLLDLRVSELTGDEPLFGNLERAYVADSIPALPETKARAIAGTQRAGIVRSGGGH